MGLEQIEIGEVYVNKQNRAITIFPNKTQKYLYPCLKEYGKEFTDRLSTVLKIAIGIGDVITTKSGLNYDKHIFIQVDTKIANSFFIAFLEWVKTQEMYENDYVYSNIQKTTHHMIVLKFPPNLIPSLKPFKLGAYSKMFTPEIIERLFSKHSETQDIFYKKESYKIQFVKIVNKTYKTNVKSSEFIGELDFSPKNSDEIFNNHLNR